MPKSPKLEKRYLPVELVENEEQKLKLGGYALKWNEVATSLPDFQERFLPGAFTEFLATGEDVRCFFNHDTDKLLGRTASGTLRLWEDEVGLAYELDLPPTPLGEEVAALVARGDLRGVSVGFRVIDESFEQTNGVLLRTISKAELFEISIAIDPVYEGTSVAFRSLDAARDEFLASAEEEKRKRLQKRFAIRLKLLELAAEQ